MTVRAPCVLYARNLSDTSSYCQSVAVGTLPLEPLESEAWSLSASLREHVSLVSPYFLHCGEASHYVPHSSAFYTFAVLSNFMSTTDFLMIPAPFAR